MRKTPHKYQVGAAFAAVAALAAYGLAGTPAASAANSPFTSHRIKVDPDVRHVSNNTDAAQFTCQGRPIDGSQGIVCYDPSQIQQAYGVKPLLDQGKDGTGRTIVIVDAYRNPYIAQDLPPVSSYLVTWGGSPLMQRAAARALLGLAPISGQLPITIPSVAPYGAGLRREARAASASPAAPVP